MHKYDGGHMKLMQAYANCPHISKFVIGIEIGPLETDLKHKIERDGMTKFHGFHEQFLISTKYIEVTSVSNKLFQTPSTGMSH